MSQLALIPSIADGGPDFGRSIQRHIDRVFRAILRGPGVQVDPSVVQLVTGEPHPFANFAMIDSRHDPAITTRAIRPLVERNAPAAALYTEPVTESVGQALASNGFQQHDPMPAMAVEIERLPQIALAAGFTFERIDPATAGAEWAKVFAEGYELPPAVASNFVPDPARGAGAVDDPLQWFAVRKNGRIVATTLLFLADGLAGIYAVATIKAERRQGLGAYLTVEALRAAGRVGYRVGVLQASPDGYPVYKRLGFADFGGVPLYVRMPV